ncbi:hypothetical protein V6N13_082305 [Hibiscus sabdariffa]
MKSQQLTYLDRCEWLAYKNNLNGVRALMRSRFSRGRRAQDAQQCTWVHEVHLEGKICMSLGFSSRSGGEEVSDDGDNFPMVSSLGSKGNNGTN